MPESAFRPFDRLTALDNDLIALCSRWPAAPAAPALGNGPLPDVPVLLLQGEDDLRTPVENAQRTAALFPRASLVVAPATGHSALGSDASGCAERAFDRFFAGKSVNTRCRRVQRLYPPTGEAPRSLRGVRSTRGVRGVRGRVVTALALTLRDVSEDSLTSLILDEEDFDLARGGGLRGGSYRLDGFGTLTLRRVEYVPGLRVSGTIRRFGERAQRGRLKLTGRPVPDGTLRLRGDVVGGRLGGRRVRGRLRPSVTIAGAKAAAASRLPGPR